MTIETTILDDNSGTVLTGDYLHVSIRRVSVSGDVEVGSFELADYNSLAAWATDAAASGPRKAPPV